MTSPALQATALVKTYRLGREQVAALRGVSLEVARGSFVAVMGPSGSGKSTLLHLLGLLDTPDSGDITLAGEAVGALGDDDRTRLRRDRLGFVFQGFELLPTLSARDNILLPAEVAGRGAEAARRLPDLAARLGIEGRLEHRPAELSGGQQQRVAVARALINNPVVLLADEPTGNLDSRTGREVLELLQQGVRDQGWTIVMVTHDPHAALYAERIIFLRDGTVSGEINTDRHEARTMIEALVAG
ncbi:MAG: ABC transporter ATP-binding protein [Trueperaceae bacterium]|nr:ABC transporter ATP-binding protein [Trueperaceae bacterium]